VPLIDGVDTSEHEGDVRAEPLGVVDFVVEALRRTPVGKIRQPSVCCRVGCEIGRTQQRACRRAADLAVNASVIAATKEFDTH
jgi:hypothetical protein